jgi:hypothetical protein
VTRTRCRESAQVRAPAATSSEATAVAGRPAAGRRSQESGCRKEGSPALLLLCPAQAFLRRPSCTCLLAAGRPCLRSLSCRRPSLVRRAFLSRYFWFLRGFGIVGEAVGTITNAQHVAVSQLVFLHWRVVDEAAIGAVHIDDRHAAWIQQQTRVIAAYRPRCNADVVLSCTADRDDVTTQGHGIALVAQRNQLTSRCERQDLRFRRRLRRLWGRR